MLGYVVVLDTMSKSNAFYFFDVHVREPFFQQETVHEFTGVALHGLNLAGKFPLTTERNRMPFGNHEASNLAQFCD